LILDEVRSASSTIVIKRIVAGAKIANFHLNGRVLEPCRHQIRQGIGKVDGNVIFGPNGKVHSL